MGDSLFTGLGDLYSPGGRSNTTIKTTPKVFPGVVTEVCLEPNSSLYRSQMDIGKISFRDPFKEFNKPENEIRKEAYPLDRSVAKYPIPGEEVIIFKALGDNGERDSTHATTEIFFYSFVVSVTHNISYNVDPFIGTDVDHVDPLNPLLSFEQAKLRFDQKRKDADLSKDGSGNVKIYKQLKPFEGDFILQGRFGTSIRFGSSSPKTSTPWMPDKTYPGVSGDGILILRVDTDNTTKESEMLTTEDINKDDSTIMLCTSQRVELNLACAKELKTWRTVYNLPSAAENGGSNIVKKEDTSQLWQKVVDITKPAASQLQTPSTL